MLAPGFNKAAMAKVLDNECMPCMLSSTYSS